MVFVVFRAGVGLVVDGLVLVVAMFGLIRLVADDVSGSCTDRRANEGSLAAASGMIADDRPAGGANEGAGGKADAIGARVTVKAGTLTQIQDLIPVTGYLSQADPRRHFGLGKETKADSVEIRWPDGQITKLTDVKANQVLTVIQEPTKTEQ